MKAGIVDKSGSWYSYDSTRIGQGRENAKTFLRENPDMAETIEKAVRADAGLVVDEFPASEADTDDDASEATA